MGTITGYTADRMKQVEDESVVAGSVNSSGRLILSTRAGTPIDAGYVVGPQGILGGPTTVRNNTFGVPSSNASIAALANKSVAWYNSDNDLIETYKANSAVPGLTVAGVSTATGWYPIGSYDRAPQGLWYKQTVSASTGGISDAIVTNIPSFFFRAGRKYRIVWDASYYQTVATDLFFWSVNTSATSDTAASLTGLTAIGGRTKGVASAGSGVTQHSGLVTAYYEPTVDGTKQIKFRIQRAVGTGSLIVVSNVGELPTYLIYDDGAQPITSVT